MYWYELKAADFKTVNRVYQFCVNATDFYKVFQKVVKPPDQGLREI